MNALERHILLGRRHDPREGEMLANDFGVWLFWKLVDLGIMCHPFAYREWRWWQLK